MYSSPITFSAIMPSGLRFFTSYFTSSHTRHLPPTPPPHPCLLCVHGKVFHPALSSALHSTSPHTPWVLTPYRILRIQPERQQVVSPYRASLNRTSDKSSFLCRPFGSSGTQTSSHPIKSQHSFVSALIEHFFDEHFMFIQHSALRASCVLNRNSNKFSLQIRNIRVIRVLTLSA